MGQVAMNNETGYRKNMRLATEIQIKVWSLYRRWSTALGMFDAVSSKRVLYPTRQQRFENATMSPAHELWLISIRSIFN